MRRAYWILLTTCFLLWMGGMYLVYLTTSNPSRAFVITKQLATILASPAFIPVFGILILLALVTAMAPTLKNLIKQSRLRNRLEQDGVRTMAQIVGIRDTGLTVNKNPRVSITVLVLGQEANFELTVSRVAIPRVGEYIAVLYDPHDPTKAVYASD